MKNLTIFNEIRGVFLVHKTYIAAFNWKEGDDTDFYFISSSFFSFFFFYWKCWVSLRILRNRMSQKKYTRAFEQTKVTGREMRDSWQTHAHTLRGRALWERTGEVVRKHPVHRHFSIHQKKKKKNSFCFWYFHFLLLFFVAQTSLQ